MDNFQSRTGARRAAACSSAIESGPPETASSREAPVGIASASAPEASAATMGANGSGLVAEGGFEPPTKGL